MWLEQCRVEDHDKKVEMKMVCLAINRLSTIMSTIVISNRNSDKDLTFFPRQRSKIVDSY